MFHAEGQGIKAAWQPPHRPVGFQVFHCHFNSNFFPLFLEHLLSDRISLSTGSFLLGEWVSRAGRAKAHTQDP